MALDKRDRQDFAAQDTLAQAAPVTRRLQQGQVNSKTVNDSAGASEKDDGHTVTDQNAPVPAIEEDPVPNDDVEGQTGTAKSTNTSAPIKKIKSKHERGWRRIVRNLSPSWFTPTMGTGIAGVLLATIPFQARWLYYLSICFFLLNVVLFSLVFMVSVLRYVLYPEIWGVMIRDPVNSLFLSTAPMGLFTLVEMWLIVTVRHEQWGEWALTFIWIVWMIDCVAAVSCTVFLCFLLTTVHAKSSLAQITAVQLLPIAATIVGAGVGSQLAQDIPHPQNALGTIIFSYVLWGIGVPLALTVIVIYFQRLAIHKIPPREVVVSCFLPLGPLGFGGTSVMLLGKAAIRVFPQTSTLSPYSEAAGQFLYFWGFITALTLWGFGLVWLVFAVASIIRARPRFNMGYWGFTFPLGVYAGSTIQIGLELPSETFKILGTIFAVAVILLWAVCFIATARGAWTGQLFHAPCLKNLPEYQYPDAQQNLSANRDLKRVA